MSASAADAIPARTSGPSTAAAPARSSVGRNRARPVILGVLVVALVAWGARFGWDAYHFEDTDNAYVEGHLHTVAPQIAGVVKSVLVEDNQLVTAGAPLVQLDPLEYQIILERAQATLAQARAQMEQAEAAVNQNSAQKAEAQARIEQAGAQVEQAAAQLKLAQLTLTRTETLASTETGALTQADLDTARSTFANSQAARAAAQANLAAAKAALISLDASAAAARAQVEAGRAAVAAGLAAVHDAERQVAATTLLAPIAGRVGNKNVEAGNRVQAGQALVAVAQTTAWVVANLKETQLPHLRPGQPATVEIDALPGRTFTATVDSVSPASGAQFALLPPDNATGNFNKVVQRVPVKLTFSPESIRELGDQLRLGLSCVVRIRVR